MFDPFEGSKENKVMWLQIAIKLAKDRCKNVPRSGAKILQHKSHLDLKS
jgi:hypothetical protein